MEIAFKSCMSQVIWCDVHLICNGKIFKAHKTVLSSVSPFLRALLLSQPCEETPTTIILPEFQLEAFSALLHYIYNGEVSIPNNIIIDFFLIIKTLEIIIANDDLEKIKEIVADVEPKYNHIDQDMKLHRKDNYEQHVLFSETQKLTDIQNVFNGERPPRTGDERLYLPNNAKMYPNKKADNGFYGINSMKSLEVPNKCEPSSPSRKSHSNLRQNRISEYSLSYTNTKQNSSKLKHMGCCNTFSNYTFGIPAFNTNGIHTYMPRENNSIPPILKFDDRIDNLASKSNETSSRRNERVIKPTALRPLPTLVPLLPCSPRTTASADLLDLSSNKFYHPNSLPQNLCQGIDLRKSIPPCSTTGPWFSKPPLGYRPVKPKPLIEEQQQTEVTSLESKLELKETLLELNDKNNNLNNSESDKTSHSSSSPRFKCQECGKIFSQLRNYKYHLSVHRGTKEFAATCSICGKHFNDRGYLSSHMKIHRNRKEYKCPHCPKSFNQRVAYNMHVRIHTGVKPHTCAECGKSFSRKMLLKQHMRTHSGERPYSCSICQKRFADRSNMTLHLRLHSGVKPFSCHLCPKSFTKKHHLKTHLNYHTGDKPYSCPKCQLAFSQSSNMRTHLKKCNGVFNKE